MKKQIKSIMMDLSWPELVDFRTWYEKFEAQQWDKQIDSDIQAGKLDQFADKVVSDFESGLCLEL